MRQATLDVIRANHLKECYIRPLAFVGLGEMGLYAPKNPVNVCIAVWPWGPILAMRIAKWHPRQGVLLYAPPRQRDDD
jgi:branched-subunit amino acid aminotransferase/4-amino-4-deoxychorismate lyase